VDLVFIADCGGDGSDKLKLAEPSIRKRVPTFIDKPLAYDVGDARKIVTLAEKMRTPILSLSILRCVPDAARFRRRLPEVGELGLGAVVGGGNNMAGYIHAISLAQHVFGNGVQTVASVGEKYLALVQLGYGSRKDRPSAGVTLNLQRGKAWHGAFHVSACGSLGAIQSSPIGDFAYPAGSAAILRCIKTMVRTGKSPVPYADMIENIAVATAARKALKLKRTVRISDV
jgi:predicted dehydrogenase